MQQLGVGNSWIPIKMVTLGGESMSVVNIVNVSIQSTQIQTGFTINAFFTQTTLQTFLPVAAVALGRALVYAFKVDFINNISNDGSTPYPFSSDAKVFGIYTNIVEYGANPANDSALNKVIQANKGFVKFKRDRDIGGHVVGINQNKIILVDIARRELNEQIMQGVGSTLTLTTVKWTKQQLRMQNFDASFQGAFEFLKDLGNFANKIVGGVKSAASTVYKLSGPLGPMALNIANQYTGGAAGLVAGALLNQE